MIAIIGGGISGLSLGYYLHQYKIPFILLERESELGGKIKSTQWESNIFEHGPNTLFTDDLVEALITSLNLRHNVKHPNKLASKNRFIVKNQKVNLLPSNPLKFLFSNVISLKAKLFALKELRFRPAHVPKLQTVSQFFTLHFGEEITETLVKTFCRGIYASNADDLLIHSCFPNLVNYQEQYGSVIKGILKNKSTAKRKIITLEGGLQTLCTSLGSHFNKFIKYSSAVTTIETSQNGYLVHTTAETFTVNKIIFCSEADTVAKLTEKLSPEISALFANIDYASVNVFHSIYQNSKLNHQGFGVLYPPKESATFLGHIWYSSIFSSDHSKLVQITSMLTLKENETQSNELSLELEQKLNLPPSQLIKRQQVSWPKAIPVYNLAQQALSEKIKEGNELNLYFCNNVIGGISVPDCIKSALKLANTLRDEK
jgi:protoporphyrinogen/coproporphyrinogen III oxidase